MKDVPRIASAEAVNSKALVAIGYPEAGVTVATAFAVARHGAPADEPAAAPMAAQGPRNRGGPIAHGAPRFRRAAMIASIAAFAALHSPRSTPASSKNALVALLGSAGL